jgi:hypothetical protein
VGSKTKSRNNVAERRSKLILRMARGQELDDKSLQFLARNRPRHKCPGCSNGGHLRRAPVFVGPEGIPFRGATRA